jgi:hypothetical protein
MFRSKSIIATVDLESKSPVGSSKSKIYGWFERALAIATRCYSPPDNSDGKWSSLSPRPTLFKRLIALYFLSFSVNLPNKIIGSSTFSRAVIVAKRLNVWKTNPICFNLSSLKKSSVEL